MVSPNPNHLDITHQVPIPDISPNPLIELTPLSGGIQSLEAEPSLTQQPGTQQQGALLKSDLTTHSLTIGMPSAGSSSTQHFFPIPPPLSSVQFPASISSSALPAEKNLMTRPYLAIPPPLSPRIASPSSSSSSSQVAFISTGLRPAIHGLGVTNDIQKITANLKKELIKKEFIERTIHERLDVYEANPAFASEIRDINDAINANKMEYDRLSIEIKTQKSISIEYVQLNAPIDISEIDEQDKRDVKLLSKKQKEINDLTSMVLKISKKINKSRNEDEKNELEKSYKELGNNLSKLEKEVEFFKSRLESRKNYRENIEKYLEVSKNYDTAQAKFQKIVEREKESQKIKSKKDEIKRELKSPGISEERKKELTGQVVGFARELESYQDVYSEKSKISAELSKLNVEKNRLSDDIRRSRQQLGQREISNQEKILLTRERSSVGEEIKRLTTELQRLERKFIDEQYAGDALPSSLGELSSALDAHELQIHSYSERLKECGEALRSFPPDIQREVIHRVAEDFLAIGKLPPRSSNPFSQFRREIIQEMVNIALTRKPPKHFGDTGVEGKEAAAGIYQITVDVDVIQPDGTYLTETRILGGFKPNDEAPGEKFAQWSLGEVQPGLPPGVADIRQALVSALGGPDTLDSVLITAQHEGFRHEIRHSNGDVETFPPPLKDGIFVEWLERAADVKEDMRTFVSRELVDNLYYVRVFEDIAFLNWDPNEGNYLPAKSSEGRMGVRYALKQFDQDKAFPEGFIAMANDPIWAKSPLAIQPLPLAIKEKILERDVEKEIAQARRFWDEEITLKQQRIQQSDDSEASKVAKIVDLEACRWTDAHANVLRAADTLLKAAVEVHATPYEIFQIFRSQGDPNFTMNDEKLMNYLGQSTTVFLGEIKKELHSFTLRDDPAQPVDLDSILCREFVKAKNWAILQVDEMIHTHKLPAAGRSDHMVRLTQEHLKRNLKNMILMNRKKRLDQSSSPRSIPSSPSSSSGSTQRAGSGGAASLFKRGLNRLRPQSLSRRDSPPSDRAESS